MWVSAFKKQISNFETISFKDSSQEMNKSIGKWDLANKKRQTYEELSNMLTD